MYDVLCLYQLYYALKIEILSTGSTSASNEIVVVIINDDDPEIDEYFEVQLVSVAESSQMIDSEHVS